MSALQDPNLVVLNSLVSFYDQQVPEQQKNALKGQDQEVHKVARNYFLAIEGDLTQGKIDISQLKIEKKPQGFFDWVKSLFTAKVPDQTQLRTARGVINDAVQRINRKELPQDQVKKADDAIQFINDLIKHFNTRQEENAKSLWGRLKGCFIEQDLIPLEEIKKIER